MIRGYYNEELCKKCKGKCCKGLPGEYSPEDIERIFPAKNLKLSVEMALKTKKIAIDWWEDDKPLYFLRPATKGNEGKIYDPSWGGECVFLKKTGCSLPKEERPEVCRLLEPRAEEDKCVSHYKENPKYAMGLLWKKTKLDLGKFNGQ
ncbi:MAG: YkgJ family cysteine cluster protein [Atribacterota bacterium]|nr:YkgJ family cysteine cluster protein [Atribacterota bacterium]